MQKKDLHELSLLVRVDGRALSIDKKSVSQKDKFACQAKVTRLARCAIVRETSLLRGDVQSQHISNQNNIDEKY